MLTEAKNNLKIMLLSIKYNLMRCMENNVAFATSIILMIANNASFIIQWLTIFAIKDNIGGYTMNDVMLFWAISSGAYGLANIIFRGVNNIPTYIEEGKLDAYLTMPKNVLCYIATSTTEPSAFGDFIYGYIALIIFNFSIHNLILYTVLIILGALIYTSFVTIFNSITFYLFRFGYVTQIAQDIFINGSLYPDVIFKRGVKIIFFTIIPSALASWIPVHLLIDFNLTSFFILIGVTILLVILAFLMFYKGLKSYNSSNLMSARF